MVRSFAGVRTWLLHYIDVYVVTARYLLREIVQRTIWPMLFPSATACFAWVRYHGRLERSCKALLDSVDRIS
jgi:hypothetical protein